ncbi:uncharacterized protein LOC102800557 [Saccoglossus kowalevskii]|uniref:Uncharacterized protein LOC102800557 n=1 Tax=Saccoglossus kowalevskii TaxID=10224 RepID=A0ABM0MMM0_SACKO|nr:PREDICTED: uncharacterized protein LOC102800557 [Saccoglossus kowalevskii]
MTSYVVVCLYTGVPSAFLRVSEFVAPTSMTFDPQRTLLTADITCNTDLVIALKASKTDPFRRGCNIIIAPSQSSVCAVQAYQAYKALHSSVAHLPAFQFANSNFLTRQAVSNHIRDLLTRASVPDVNCYTTHSFRSGAATTAADANLPDWLIKALGRWRSDAYQTYIRTPPASSAQFRVTCHLLFLNCNFDICLEISFRFRYMYLQCI